MLRLFARTRTSRVRRAAGCPKNVRASDKFSGISRSNSSTSLNIIVAVAENGVIGRDGDLPWKNLAEDKAHLHRCIRGNVVLHGSKIYEELGGKVLPDCTTVILSRDKRKRFDGASGTARSLNGALRKAADLASPRDASVWILGGSEIYREALPRADVLWYTAVRSRPRGDVFFPHWWRTYFSVETGALVAEFDAVPGEDRPGYAIYKFERRCSRLAPLPGSVSLGGRVGWADEMR